ncbi:hypothetical protein FACS189494_03780 [Spirochaetia bacterium]|nr:hypothetical protein FACS189494_03780 [Spirochaetia bacterium]
MKSFVKIAISFVLLTALFTNCKNKNSSGSGIDSLLTNYAGNYDIESDAELAPEDAIRAAFTLDYRPQRPEPVSIMETLTSAETSSAAAASSQGQQIGGGLRSISKYKTRYYDPTADKERIAEIIALQAKANEVINLEKDPGNLTVVDWGPRNFLSASVQRPSMYVIFSQPMAPLASLSVQQSGESPILRITPPVKGVFRWYGTSFLSFEADEPVQSQQVYTMTVADNVKSLYGKTITGITDFTFETERLSMSDIIPGEEFKKKNNFHFGTNDVPPAAAKEVTIIFNYPVAANDIKDFLQVDTSGGTKNFSLTQIDKFKILATVNDNIEFNTTVRITLKEGAKSGNGTLGTQADQSRTFNTPRTFIVREIDRQSSWGKYKNLVDIDFSYPVEKRTVKNAIHTEPKMDITDNNLEIWGNTVRLYNLPVTYNQRYTVNINENVKDIYGRPLERTYNKLIIVPPEPPPEGSAYFLDSGNVMLEAAFKPRLIFEYKNNTGNSWYELTSKNNPFADYTTKTETFNLKLGEKNYRYFEDIDLTKFLNPQRKGFVSFYANIDLLSPEKDSSTGKQKTYQRENKLNIQVTDLGITVRYAFNRAVVLVTSISTGAPVEDASVKIISPVEANDPAVRDISSMNNFGSAKTDKNGLAIIELNAGVLRNNTNHSNAWFDEPFILAEKDGDRAVFGLNYPTAHNSWAYDIYSQNPQYAEVVTPVTFMYSDRGLYKPGETITFRGVDKTLVLGMYAPYKGDWEVSLETDDYSNERIITVGGTTSDSGGYYNTISIPSDVTPGSYRLVYKRINANKTTVSANTPITIAFFERLKFQASIKAPVAPVISGEDVNMSLNASYLSGGSLAGAAYEASWYRELAGFRPNTPELKDYIFGPRNAYDGKRYIGDSKGALSAAGGAPLSQKTGGDLVTGAAYYYSVEASVTDISNQMISAYQSALVHPARFYIGVDKPASRGFPKAGDEILFSYVTVDPAGTLLNGNALFLKSGEDSNKITVELIREDWKRVQQPGVNGYVYDRYEKENITETTQKIDIKTKGGFKVKPLKAGFYILRVTAFDRDGRKVLTERSFYATGSDWGYWNMNNAAELRLTPDQSVYNPGDTAQVLLQSSLPVGNYLITVEREGIFTQEVRRFEESVSIIDIPIARNFVPVVYVSVASYSVRSGEPAHTYGSPDLDKPKGYYGVTKLFVNPRVRAFSVKVETNKKVFRPGDEVTLTLTAERDGRALPNAELTLMAVDRGVLDLINYHVPDPISYFYSEERFNLKTAGGDSRAWLMDPVTYSVKNLEGGEGDSKIEERVDFNPTAVFEPFLITDAKGKVQCTFKLPDTLTTYRITIFGVQGDLFSLKESEIAAQNKINVMQIQSRRMRERDTAETGVLISNLDSAAHKVTVGLSVTPKTENKDDDESGIISAAGAAFVDGDSSRTLTVKSGENAVVYFDVAAEKHGLVNLVYTITSDILNEKLIQPITIEKPYIKETVTATGQLTSANTGTEGLVLPSWADDGMGSLKITLDATRLSLLESSINYLFHYPYGCMEQRSAAIWPLVTFGEYLDDFDLKNEVSDPKKVVENEIKSWAKVQLPSGGFPYWPSGLKADSYVSLRIAHIIAIAKQKNYRVPSSLNVDKLISYLNSEYQKNYREGRVSAGNDYLQSYMLYVFSLLKQPVDASRLAEILRHEKVTPAAVAFCGMTYLNIGRTNEAAALTLRNLLRPTTRGVDLTSVNDDNSFYYGGKIEEYALILEFFVRQYPGDEICTRLLYTLLENKRSSGYWTSTAVTVRVLSAVDALIRADNIEKTNLTSNVSLNGTELFNGSFSGLAAKVQTQTFDISAFPIAGMQRDKSLPLVFSKKGAGNIYWTSSLTYALPPELQSVRDEGIGVALQILELDDTEIKDSVLESGKMYRAKVRLASSRDRNYLALRVPIPSGAEILDAAFVTTTAHATDGGRDENEKDGYYNGRHVSNQFIFDNEVQYFWDYFEKGETTVQFLFRAARRGVFPTPPLQAECMYEEEIFGRTAGTLYTIK